MKIINNNHIFLKVIRFIFNKVKLNFKAINRHFFPIKLSDKDVLDFFGIEINDFLKKKSSSFFFDPTYKKEIIKQVKKLHPESMKKTVKDADDVCAHNFQLLGSPKTYLGEKIDWHWDFKNEYSWNPNKYYLGTNAHLEYVKKQVFADVKYPWELSRFYHTVTLGKSYWYTDNEKYTQEFKSQIESWILANPVEIGVNWISAMEVAIRVINWIWGYYFFFNSNILDEKFRIELFKSLILHGKFIENHLESKYHNNHYLADIVGLVYLGIFFQESKEGKKWLEKGLSMLIEEMSLQVHSDGVDCEGSTSYHRLVTELFLSAMILCIKNGIEFPEWYLKRLELMCEFVKYYSKPDGSSPQIGDFDDGRVHILSNYHDWDKLDHLYLLNVASEIFQRPDFRLCNSTLAEDAFWLLGGHMGESDHNKRSYCTCSKKFPKAGFYIMRHDDNFMIIDALSPDSKYSQGHHHNSALNFELFVGDKTFILDPGSYIYTSDKKMRNLFRSTEYHNVVRVDNEEQNCFNENDLFDMGTDAKVDVLNFEIYNDHDYFEGLHHGYERLKEQVIHRRQIIYDKKENFWIIKDLLEGEGKHQFDLHFHFAPMHLVSLEQKDLSVKTETKGTNLALIPLEKEDLSLEITEGWVSYGYGRKVKAPVVKYSKKTKTPTSFLTLLLPFQKKDDLNRIIDKLEKFDNHFNLYNL